MHNPLDYGCGTHAFPYACFTCRKSFKRPLVSLAKPRSIGKSTRTEFERSARQFEREFSHKCPHCGGVAHFMGRDFKAPKTPDKKAWAIVEKFINSGRTYHHQTPVDDVR